MSWLMAPHVSEERWGSLNAAQKILMLPTVLAWHRSDVHRAWHNSATAEGVASHVPNSPFALTQLDCRTAHYRFFFAELFRVVRPDKIASPPLRERVVFAHTLADRLAETPPWGSPNWPLFRNGAVTLAAALPQDNWHFRPILSSYPAFDPPAVTLAVNMLIEILDNDTEGHGHTITALDRVGGLIWHVMGYPWRRSTRREWQTRTVVSLARDAWAESRLDNLPVLADALQDADCDDESLPNMGFSP